MNTSHLPSLNAQPLAGSWCYYSMVVGVVALGWVLVGCGSDTARTSRAADSSEPVLVAEENTGATVLTLTTYGNRFVQADLGIRIIPWINSSSDGFRTAKIRLGFGTVRLKGAGLDVMQAMGSVITGAPPESKGFEETTAIQLTIPETKQLLELIRKVDRVRFGSPPANVKYRSVTASFGNLRLRISPGQSPELFLWNDSDLGEVWAPYESKELQKLLNSSIESLETLTRQKRSIQWK